MLAALCRHRRRQINRGRAARLRGRRIYLPVPPYHFLSETMIRIGENPENVKFEFGSIRQI
jgi:hypothetical protein